MMTVEERVRHQFPGLFVTLVSVLIGLVLADLVSEARDRMVLWPLDASTLRTWAQLAGVGCCAIASWIVYSHLGIARQCVPTLPDTIVAFLIPMPLLVLTGLAGRAEIWPYFYASGVFCVIGASASVWHTMMTVEEPGLDGLRPLLRPNGYLSAMYLGAPAYLTIGWADQSGLLSLWMETLVAASAPVTALYCAFRFVEDWRPAVTSAAMVRPARAGAV
jgi:hypothetical protein